jgi:hypothetical protein
VTLRSLGFAALLGLLVLAAFLAIGYFVQGRATSEPIYRLGPTRACLKGKGHSVTVYPGPSDPAEAPQRQLVIDDVPPGKVSRFPDLVFFTNVDDAFEFAKGDSVPLLRRGNVVLNFEKYEGVESDPYVRAALRCLRPPNT